MTVTSLVKPDGALAAERAGLYDVDDITYVAGDLMAAGEPSSIAGVAAAIRSDVYSGRWAPGEQMPTREQLAAVHGVSAESAGVALRMLRAEGLVSLEQGRGTFVCRLSDYRVEIVAEAPAESARADSRALAAVRSSDPSVRRLRCEDKSGLRHWLMILRAADAGRAAVAGLAIARSTAGAGPLDFTRASVSAEIAE